MKIQELNRFVRLQKMKDTYGIIYHRDFEHPIFVRTNFERFKQYWLDYNRAFSTGNKKAMLRFLKNTNGGMIIEDGIVMRIKDIILMIPVWRMAEPRDEETEKMFDVRFKKYKELDEKMMGFAVTVDEDEEEGQEG